MSQEAILVWLIFCACVGWFSLGEISVLGCFLGRLASLALFLIVIPLLIRMHGILSLIHPRWDLAYLYQAGLALSWLTLFLAVLWTCWKSFGITYVIQHWFVRLRLPKIDRRDLQVRQKEWRRRFLANEPLTFPFVKNEGRVVGFPIKVTHLTFHEMMPHAVWARMTNEVLLGGLKANAVEIVGFRRINKYNGVTTVQPRWVPGKTAT